MVAIVAPNASPMRSSFEELIFMVSPGNARMDTIDVCVRFRLEIYETGLIWVGQERAVKMAI